MISRPSKACLSLGAILAVAALFGSSASAQFEFEGVPIGGARSANTTQELTYNEGIVVKCTTVGGSGEQTVTPSEDFRFNPTYTGCTAPGVGSAEVSMNTCGYTFTSAKGSTSIATHIVCPEGGMISITVKALGTSVCTLHMSPQTPGGTITARNIGSGTTREIEVTWNSNGIAMTRTGSSLCGPESSTSGTFKGSMTITGFRPSNHEHRGMFMD